MEKRTAEGWKAKQEYTNKYNDAAYDRLAVRIPKGERDRLKAEAAARGVSLANFVMLAANDYIKLHPVE